ncbi:PH domain-containing protein [Clostridium chrysemydis]|uniref:PH domain-containing protein n=1 Tax=Clostridium chrysemydis TaxID=2665504 RepID=UPI001884698A|nr:PH domain-containing protein [Clostridium chrysemydis]
MDLCEILWKKDYNRADSIYYTLKEENERIFFLLKNSNEEFCFTNKALIHITKDTFNPKINNIFRYYFYRNKISNVNLQIIEDADMFLELKFDISDTTILLALDIKELSNINKLYKALISIEEMYIQSDFSLNTSSKSLETACEVLSKSSSKEMTISQDFRAITKFTEEWITNARDKYTLYDLSEVFNKFRL